MSPTSALSWHYVPLCGKIMCKNNLSVLISLPAYRGSGSSTVCHKRWYLSQQLLQSGHGLSFLVALSWRRLTVPVLHFQGLEVQQRFQTSTKTLQMNICRFPFRASASASSYLPPGYVKMLHHCPVIHNFANVTSTPTTVVTYPHNSPRSVWSPGSVWHCTPVVNKKCPLKVTVLMLHMNISFSRLL